LNRKTLKVSFANENCDYKKVFNVNVVLDFHEITFRVSSKIMEY